MSPVPPRMPSEPRGSSVPPPAPFGQPQPPKQTEAPPPEPPPYRSAEEDHSSQSDLCKSPGDLFTTDRVRQIEIEDHADDLGLWFVDGKTLPFVGAGDN